MKKIIFNGREYSSVDEMPPDVREAYERITRTFADSDGDGVPDVLEGLAGNTVSTTTSKIVVNGREYSSVDEMPPDVRQIYERMAEMRADSDGDGMPDIFEGKGANVVTVTRSNVVVDDRGLPGAGRIPADVRCAFGGRPGRTPRVVRKVRQTRVHTGRRTGIATVPEGDQSTMEAFEEETARESKLTLAAIVIAVLLLVIVGLLLILGLVVNR
jgi:hypothetical protein